MSADVEPIPTDTLPPIGSSGRGYACSVAKLSLAHVNLIDAVLIPTVSLAFLRPPVVALWNQCAFTMVDTPTFTENVFTPT